MQDAANGSTDRSLRKFRAWFLAAAVYNVCWGLAAILFPHAIFDLTGMARSNYPSLFQCIGMMVLTFSLGYLLMARDPVRYASFVWIGLAGKTFGPIGFFIAATNRELSWSFGWTILFNDIVWHPVFWAFALKYARPKSQK